MEVFSNVFRRCLVFHDVHSFLMNVDWILFWTRNLLEAVFNLGRHVSELLELSTHLLSLFLTVRKQISLIVWNHFFVSFCSLFLKIVEVFKYVGYGLLICWGALLEHLQGAHYDWKLRDHFFKGLSKFFSWTCNSSASFTSKVIVILSCGLDCGVMMVLWNAHIGRMASLSETLLANHVRLGRRSVWNLTRLSLARTWWVIASWGLRGPCRSGRAWCRCSCRLRGHWWGDVRERFSSGLVN